MQLKTILNHIENYQSFVYGKMRLHEKNEQLELEVQIQPRRNSRAICSSPKTSVAGMKKASLMVK